MRRAFEDVPIAGTIVIGEGERDEAPMLFIGEKVGRRAQPGAYPAWISRSIRWRAPICAPRARPILSPSWRLRKRGGLLHAPDCYMEKIVAGPGCQGRGGSGRSGEDNLKAIARRLERGVDDLVVMVLDRPGMKS